MKFNKPKFWNKKNHIFSIILIPFSYILLIVIFFKKKFTKPIMFNIPIICVGNIYLGGTGKTPLSLLISKELKNKNKNPAIVRKFYKDHNDEINLINNNEGNLFVDIERSRAITNAEELGHDFIILDDGYQDCSIKKNLNIICVNQKQNFGNERILPSGPLREPLDAMKNCNIVMINGNYDQDLENKIKKISQNIKFFYSKYQPKFIENFKNNSYLAFAGIGNPENFFDLLSENKIKIKKKIVFPDHYNFTLKEIIKLKQEADNLNVDLITTEKDYFRIKNKGINYIKYLAVKLEILDKDKFIEEVLKT